MSEEHIHGLKVFLEKYSDFIEQRKLNKDPAGAEFQIIKQQAAEDKCKLSALEGAKEVNKKKNRYKDILPYDYTRVVLPKEKSQDGSDYINANFITDGSGKISYIASQGPMPSTVDDFWRMIWCNNVKLMIMACKEVELGKSRCHRYWPEEGEEVMFKDIKVTLCSKRAFTPTLTLRDLKLQKKNKEHFVTQMHYTDWPDHGAPETTEPIIQLVKLARKKHPENSPPIVIHCSAGCGRTGAIIAIDYARKLLAEQRGQEIDILQIVMNLRKQRPAMVQAKEQLEFLYEVLREMVSVELCKYGEISDDEENSTYVNIGFAHQAKDHKNSPQRSLSDKSSPSIEKREIILPTEHLVNTTSNFRRSRSLFGRNSGRSDPRTSHSLVVTQKPPTQLKVMPQPEEKQRNSPNVKRREELFQQIRSIHQPRNERFAENNSSARVVSPVSVEEYFPPPQPVDINSYPMKIKKSNVSKPLALIPPNTLSSSSMKIQAVDTTSYPLSNVLNESTASQSSPWQPLFKSPDVIEPEYGILKKTDTSNKAPSNNVIPFRANQKPVGVVVPYAVTNIGGASTRQQKQQPQTAQQQQRDTYAGSDVASSWRLSVEVNSSNAPPLPERTPDSFIIVTECQQQQQQQQQSASTYQPVGTANTTSEYAVLQKQLSAETPAPPLPSPTPSPTTKHWFRNIKNIKNIGKKPMKPEGNPSFVFGIDNLNTIGFPHRIKNKPKGPRMQPSHW